MILSPFVSFMGIYMRNLSCGNDGRWFVAGFGSPSVAIIAGGWEKQVVSSSVPQEDDLVTLTSIFKDAIQDKRVRARLAALAGVKNAPTTRQKKWLWSVMAKRRGRCNVTVHSQTTCLSVAQPR